MVGRDFEKLNIIDEKHFTNYMLEVSLFGERNSSRFCLGLKDLNLCTVPIKASVVIFGNRLRFLDRLHQLGGTRGSRLGYRSRWSRHLRCRRLPTATGDDL